MIARLLKMLLALQLLAVAGLWYMARTSWQIEQTVPALLLGVGAVILFRVVISGHNFWRSWRGGSPTPSQFRPTPAQRLRLAGAEFAASMLSSSWHMAWPKPGLHLVPGARSLPVLLLHGYGCNGGYWAKLGQRLRQAGIGYQALDMELAPDASLDDYVPLVRRAINDLCVKSGSARVVIVAHSMGGLVARAYLRQHGADQVARVITLGTPHHGTQLASFGYGLNAQQMRRGAAGPSAWLLALDEAEGEQRRALLTSIFSHHDNIVVPQTSSYLAGAKNIEFGAIGHVALGSDPRILQCVLDEIALASAAAAPAPLAAAG